MLETVSVGVANEKEKQISIEELKNWNPKDLHTFGDIIYFKHENKFYNMKRVDFNKIFKN
jgi:hypothetical protein